MWKTRERYFGLALLSLSALACANQEAAKRDQIEMLQRIAIEEAKSGQATSARALLLESERLGLEAGLKSDPLLIRTHMALGAIYANDLKDEGRGVEYMRQALAETPQAKLPQGMGSPPARRALAIARGHNPDAAAEAKLAKEEEAAASAPVPAGPAPQPVPLVQPAPGSGFPGEIAPSDPRTAAKEAEAAAAQTAKEPVPDAKTVTRDEALAVAGPPPPAEEPTIETPPEPVEPIRCPLPLEAPPRRDVVLKCSIGGPGVKSTRLVLFYRPAGTARFTQVPMPRLGQGGSFTGVIPAHATRGKSLQFYVETRGAMKVSFGSSESPNLLIVRAGAAPVGESSIASAGGGGGGVESASAIESAGGESAKNEGIPVPYDVKTSGEDNPLAALDAARQLSMLRRRPVGHFWAAFGLGKGYGWQPGGKLEFRREREISAGALPGGLLQLLPEVGYQLRDHLSVSAQLRIEYLPTTGSMDPVAGAPVTRAAALLLRAAYTFGDRKLQPLATACIGGGDGFRLRVANDRSIDLARSDTVRGGPLVAGAGGGIIYNFSQRLAIPAEARVLLGFPSSAVAVEVGTSVAYTF